MIVYVQAEFVSSAEELLIAPLRRLFQGRWVRRDGMDFRALPAARWAIPPGIGPTSLCYLTLWSEPAGGVFLARAPLREWSPDWQGHLVIEELTVDLRLDDPMEDVLVDRWRRRQ